MEEKMGGGAKWITRLPSCLTYVSFLVWPFRHGCCGDAGPEPRVGGAADSRLPTTVLVASKKLVAPPDSAERFADAVTRQRHHPIVSSSWPSLWERIQISFQWEATMLD